VGRRPGKRKLLKAVKKINLDSISDNKFFYDTDIEYSHLDMVNEIYDTLPSCFCELSDEEKQVLIFFDLCSNSRLAKIFYSDIPFYSGDWYKIVDFLRISKTSFDEIITKLQTVGLIEIYRCKYFLTKKYEEELMRLSTIPHFAEVNLEYFEVQSSQKKLDNGFTAFSGDCVSYYVYTKLKTEKCSFYYVPSLYKCVDLLNHFDIAGMSNKTVWIDNYLNKNSEMEQEIQNIAKRRRIKIIVSGVVQYPLFGIESSCVQMKESCVEDIVKQIYPPEIAEPINDYFVKNNIPYEEKRGLIFGINEFLALNHNPQYVAQRLPEILSTANPADDEKCSEGDNIDIEDNEEDKTSDETSVVDVDEFQNRYETELNFDNDQVKNQIMEIFHKLERSAVFLKTDRNMLDELEKLLDQHPNILNKDLLCDYLKNAILFSKQSKIKIPPLLFVGNPGCGKTLFCKQLRQLLCQDNDIFIPMGSGAGVDYLMGSTPGYKNATNGKILSAIWEAKKNVNCLNPVIVFDEIDKVSFNERIGDVNQNMGPTLIQLFGDENFLHFKDNFFDVSLQNYNPNFLATANSTEPIPEPLLDRLNIVKFRDYTHEELKNLVIPFQYQSFKNEHNELAPDCLSSEELEIIYKLSGKNTRQIQPSINKYLAAAFDLDGKKHQLDSNAIEKLVAKSNNSYEEKQQIGFCM